LQVKASFFSLLSSLISDLPKLANEKADKLCPVVLSRLGENDPLVCPSLWEAVHSVTTIQVLNILYIFTVLELYAITILLYYYITNVYYDITVSFTEGFTSVAWYRLMNYIYAKSRYKYLHFQANAIIPTCNKSNELTQFSLVIQY